MRVCDSGMDCPMVHYAPHLHCLPTINSPELAHRRCAGLQTRRMAHTLLSWRQRGGRECGWPRRWRCSGTGG